MPQVLGMDQQLFRDEERGPTTGGPVIGLGGAANGWRPLFAINAPLGIAAIIFSLRLLPRQQDNEKGNRFGRALVVVGIATVIVGVRHYCSSHPTRTRLDRRVVHGHRSFAGRRRRRTGHPAQPDFHPVRDPGNEGSAAGSMTQLGQRLGTAVGVSALTAVFFRVILASGHKLAC